MDYRSTASEPDVYIKRKTTDNGTDYYKYMLVYVNDVLHLAKGAQEYMLKINHLYQLKEGFGPPDRFLGANVDKSQLEYGRIFWSMTCLEYLHGAIKKVDSIPEGNKSTLKSFGDGNHPYHSPYRTELDITNGLDAELINKFQQII